MIKVRQVKDIGILICMLVGVMLLVLTATGAKAAELKVTWSTPTMYTNNVPLPKNQISRYGLRYRNVVTGVSRMKYPKVTTNGYLLIVEPGTYRLDMRTYLINGVSSDWSSPVTVTAP